MAESLKRLLSLAPAFLIGALFAYAGAIKIWDFKAGDWATQDFFTAVQNFQLTSGDVSKIIAIYLPWVELIAGLALIFRRLAAGALLLLAALTLVFLVALLSAWARGLDISCGCFGKENNGTNFPKHIAEDGALFAGLALAWWSECRASKGKSAPAL
jgi:putative oxidoreductase